MINVEEAQLKTFGVTVKALMISGKQVTLSVFRQLEAKDLYDDDSGEMRGTPWGRVNYFFGECEKRTHLHVVWQEGQELRRACVFPNDGWEWSRDNKDHLQKLNDEVRRLFNAASHIKMREEEAKNGSDMSKRDLERMCAQEGVSVEGCGPEMGNKIASAQNKVDRYKECCEARNSAVAKRYAECLKLDQLFIAV